MKEKCSVESSNFIPALFIFFSNKFRVWKPALQLGRQLETSRRSGGDEEQLLSGSFSVIKFEKLEPQLVS